MIYKITYQKKGEAKEKEWRTEDKSILSEAIIQLWKWIWSLDWDLINWFQELTKIQIFEQNYDLEDSWDYFELRETSEWERREMWAHDYDYAQISLNNDFIPLKKDITNKIFNEYNIVGKPLDNNTRLEWDVLIIRNAQFPLKSESKIKDIFSILFELKTETKLEISYEEMLKVYEKWWYKSLTKSDINEPCIRDLIKKKIPTITERLHLDKPYIQISVDKITFQS